MEKEGEDLLRMSDLRREAPALPEDHDGLWMLYSVSSDGGERMLGLGAGLGMARTDIRMAWGRAERFQV